MTNLQKHWGGRSALQKPLNGSNLSARHLASMGKIQGTLCISGPINLREYKSVITGCARRTLLRPSHRPLKARRQRMKVDYPLIVLDNQILHVELGALRKHLSQLGERCLR